MVERINYGTVKNTGPTNIDDGSSNVIAESFQSGAASVANLEYEEKENKENGDKEENGENGKGAELDAIAEKLKAAGESNDATITPEKSSKDKKPFKETKVGEGLGKIGKFLTFWKKK